MINVARLPESDRRELFRNTADKDGIEDKVNINDYEVGFVLEKVSTK